MHADKTVSKLFRVRIGKNKRQFKILNDYIINTISTA